ncbi:hypothetical protein KDX31_03595 [Amphritea atlantica]|uniref:Uncharacterized protein n=1 Tax=Amphritea atlantica TaxID=355243 RepID=A0ABY5GVT8_9GAMM|nr:hypothetical protein KDX31_03595 [Amphritea atlantica]
MDVFEKLKGIEMVKLVIRTLHCVLTCLLVFSLAGCAGNPPVDPAKLSAPQHLTCVYLDESLSFSGKYGILKYTWTTRLERGAYWSEKVDEKGTFYRAPTGGIWIGNKERGAYTKGGTADGGFYVPHDKNEPVKTYSYLSSVAVPPVVPPQNYDCSNTVFTRNPETSKISVVTLAGAGAVGGALNGLVTQGIAGRGVSYGQAAGAGLAGGAIGGLIVGAIINSDVGKIIDGQEITDQAFASKLKELERNKVLLKEVRWSSLTEDAQPVGATAMD